MSDRDDKTASEWLRASHLTMGMGEAVFAAYADRLAALLARVRAEERERVVDQCRARMLVALAVSTGCDGRDGERMMKRDQAHYIREIADFVLDHDFDGGPEDAGAHLQWAVSAVHAHMQEFMATPEYHAAAIPDSAEEATDAE